MSQRAYLSSKLYDVEKERDNYKQIAEKGTRLYNGIHNTDGKTVEELTLLAKVEDLSWEIEHERSL